MKSFRRMACLAVAAIALFAGVLSAARHESTETLLQRAYFLEQAKSDFTAAALLYAQVLAAKDAGSDSKALAGERLALCREEIAVEDPARLMPPAPLAYVEAHSAAERFRQLLDRLGLLARDDRPPVPGQNNLAVSPALIKTLADLRRAALAVTGFNGSTGKPTVVVVIHSSHLGFIETILPAAARVLPPVHGYPIYQSGDSFLAVTRRLYLFASTQQEIVDALKRLSGEESSSLATDPQWSEILRDRRDDPLFFFVQPKLLLTLLKMPPTTGAPSEQLPPAWQALLGSQGSQALSGRMGYGADGFTLDLMLHREGAPARAPEGLPLTLDREILRSVPAGTALLFALAMPAPAPETTLPAMNQPPVPALPNIMRVILAAIRGIVIYLLPPVDGGQATPEIVALATARDVAKLQALESMAQVLAGPAAASPRADEARPQISTAPARSFHIGDKLTVRSAWVGDRFFLATSETALKRALDAARSGQSVPDDPAISRLAPAALMALFARVGPCLAAARIFMAPGAAARLEPLAGLLAHTSIALTVERSERSLKASAAISGIPDVSSFVNRMLTEKQRLQTQLQEARAAQGEQSVRALVQMARQLAQEANGADAVRKIFDLLAIEKHDPAGASVVAESFVQAAGNDAKALNNFAWSLLTEEKYGKRFNDIALRVSRRSNELTRQQSWIFLDTLALAEFETGNLRRAIQLEQQAARLLEAEGGDNGLADVLKTLKRFRSTLAKRPRSKPTRTH